MTGALDADGHLLRVSGMEATLLAVRRKGFRLVAPEANRLVPGLVHGLLEQLCRVPVVEPFRSTAPRSAALSFHLTW